MSNPPSSLRRRKQIRVLLRRHKGRLKGRSPNGPFNNRLIIRNIQPSIKILLRSRARLPRSILPHLLRLLFSVHHTLIRGTGKIVNRGTKVLNTTMFRLPVRPTSANRHIPRSNFILQTIRSVIPSTFRHNTRRLNLKYGMIMSTTRQRATNHDRNTSISHYPSVLLSRNAANFWSVLFKNYNGVRTVASG